MMTKWQTSWWAACAAVAVVTSSMGCELIASVDRDKIPGPDASTSSGTGGAAGSTGAGGSPTDATPDVEIPEAGAEASPEASRVDGGDAAADMGVGDVSSDRGADGPRDG